MSASKRVSTVFGPELASRLDAAAACRAVSFSSRSEAIARLVVAHSFDATLARLAHRDALSIALAPDTGGYARLDAVPTADALDMFSRLPSGGALLMARFEDEALLDGAAALAEHLCLSRPEGLRCELIVTRRGHFTRAHVDDPPGLNVQLSGRKRWCVSEGRALAEPRTEEMAYVGHPEAGVEDGARHLDASLVMGPGDGLFIPAGTWHQVEALDDSVSLLVSFDCRRERWVDVIVAALQAALVSCDAARAPWILGARDAARASGALALASLQAAASALEAEALVGR